MMSYELWIAAMWCVHDLQFIRSYNPVFFQHVCFFSQNVTTYLFTLKLHWLIDSLIHWFLQQNKLKTKFIIVSFRSQNSGSQFTVGLLLLVKNIAVSSSVGSLGLQFGNASEVQLGQVLKTGSGENSCLFLLKTSFQAVKEKNNELKEVHRAEENCRVRWRFSAGLSHLNLW